MPTNRMSVAEYHKYIAKTPKIPKYRNIKTEVEGIIFDSKAEANRYVELRHMERVREIRGFNRQPSFVLNDGGAIIRYKPDFIIWGKDGVPWVEDVKGVETAAFKLKRKLWDREYPHMELRVI